MNPDLLAPIRANDPVDKTIGSARFINAILAEARRVRSGEFANRSKSQDSRQVGTLIIDVQNDSGEDLEVMSIVSPAGVLIDPVDFPIDVQESPSIKVGIPASEADQPLILLEPIPADAVGVAAVSGVAVCDVEITDILHEWARPIEADATKLLSATSGPVRLLTGWGVVGSAVRCMVLISSTGGSGTAERWMRVTAELPDADPGPYTGIGVEKVGNSWVDVSPTIVYEGVYRAESNEDVPLIPVDQVVRLIPSPTDPDTWEIAAVGGVQTETFMVDQGWGCYTQAEVEIKARDLTVNVTAGEEDPKILTSPEMAVDYSFDAETCALTVTYKVMVINLCDLTITFEDPP